MSFHFLLYPIKKWKFLEMKTKNLTTKTEIMFIGLTTSRETISIEITDCEEPNYISYINF